MSFDFESFVNSMNGVFKEMVPADLINGPFENCESAEIYADVSSVLNIEGKISGKIVLTLSENGALILTKKLTGEEAELNDQIVSDVAGEFLNMIVGAAMKSTAVKFDFGDPVVPITKALKNQKVEVLQKHCKRMVLSKMNGEEVGLFLIEILT